MSVSADFYSLTDRTTRTDLHVDERLEAVENSAAPVIDTLLATEALPSPRSDERHILASFVAQLACRTRRERREFETLAEAYLKVRLANSRRETAVAILEEAGQLPNPLFDQFRAGTVTLDELQIELHPETHLRLLLQKAEAIRHLMLSRPWQLWSFPSPRLLTSDDPVVLMPDPTAPADVVLSHGTARMILIPLDRTRALVIHQPGPAEVTRRWPAKSAEAVRGLIVGGAHREVYGHPTDPLTDITEQNVGAFTGQLMAEQVHGKRIKLPTVDGLNGPPTRKDPRRRRR